MIPQPDQNSPDSQQSVTSSAPAEVKTPAKKACQLPDWRPLGAVRDYFAEQLRQDSFR